VKAAVLERFNEPLRVQDVPDPRPAAGEVVVRVRATGLCGTDLKVNSGVLPSVKLPLIPGHEVAGELADDVGELKRGQPVACYLYEWCGTCRVCRLGLNSLCGDLVRLGVERDGGLAEYVALPARNVLPIGPDLPFEHAATSMDAVLTPWRGLRRRADVKEGEFVAVVGAGGLGLNAVQIATMVGARAAVVDPAASHRAAALEVGAELALAPQDAGRLREWSGGGADIAVDSSGVPAGFRTAFDAVRPGGRVVCLGYKVGTDYAFDSKRIPLEEITILGARVGTAADARDVLDAVQAGHIRPTVTQRVALDEVNTALGHLEAGTVIGRIVIDQSGDGG
jgi:propanol-preferring alcohol dehydrogenase